MRLIGEVHARIVWLAMVLCPGVLLAQATTVSLVTSANPAVFGQSLTLTATVSPAAATGNVTFYDGTAVLAIRADIWIWGCRGGCADYREMVSRQG